MSDPKLFRTSTTAVEELKGSSVDLEKSLQSLIERHLETFLGVRFLSTEHSTGKVHGGRIDTLGIDEDNCPVIIEYKRTSNENVINQDLFYLDWLMDHRGDFKDLVVKKLGQSVAEAIDWSGPRLICIASDFTRYDEYAIQQIDRNIDLMRYRRYASELLLLDLVNKVSSGPIAEGNGSEKGTPASQTYKTVEQQLASAPAATVELFESVKAYCQALGDDVQMKTTKYYYAFRRLKNFACVEVQMKHLNVYLNVDVDSVKLVDGFSRDVRKIGHWGTGKLEIRLSSPDDFEAAKQLLQKSYDNS